MKTCRSCGGAEAVVSIISKVGGFTKTDLCNQCCLKEERRLSSKGIQFKKREIKKINTHWI